MDTNDRKSPTAPDALMVFLATTTVCLLGLLASVRLRPDWFGLRPAGPSPGLAPLEVRPPEPEGLLADQESRPVVPLRASEPTDAQVIFADALPSVVHVTTRSRDDELRMSTEFISGTGSGLVWDDRGHIVTCMHVVADATSALVTLSDGSEWEAKLVGLDFASDLAVVRIDAPPESMTPIRVGTSDDIQVGGRVYSVACPYGIGHSLSVGYVSGLVRRIRAPAVLGRGVVILDGMIQTDAAIHPGSSGGALIDDQGRVVGLNAAIHLKSRRQVGVGFAHPIDRLQAVVPSIIKNGFRWSSRFGFVTASDMNSSALLEQLNSQNAAPLTGIVIAEVSENGPAGAAGLRAMLSLRKESGDETLVVRDVIVAVGGQRLTSRDDVDRAIAALAGDEPLVLTVARPSGEVDVVIESPGANPR